MVQSSNYEDTLSLYIYIINIINIYICPDISQVETSPADEFPPGSGEPSHTDAGDERQPLQTAVAGLTRLDTTRLEARDLGTKGDIMEGSVSKYYIIYYMFVYSYNKYLLYKCTVCKDDTYKISVYIYNT